MQAKFLPGAPLIFSRRSPMKRQRAQTSSSAGASPAAGTILAPVAQRRGSGLKPRSVSVRIRPGAFSQRPRSPTAETSASKAEQCECNSRHGHQWNVNRTSEPGLFAKEIGPVFTAPGEHALRVPPFSSSSKARECKETSKRPFKPFLVGASPTTGAIHFLLV